MEILRLLLPPCDSPYTIAANAGEYSWPGGGEYGELNGDVGEVGSVDGKFRDVGGRRRIDFGGGEGIRARPVQGSAI